MSRTKESIHDVLEMPDPDDIRTLSIQRCYREFLEQLEPDPSGRFILSDPYFFKVEPQGVEHSTDAWLNNQDSDIKNKIYLFSVIYKSYTMKEISCDGFKFADFPLVSELFPLNDIPIGDQSKYNEDINDVINNTNNYLYDPCLIKLSQRLSSNAIIEQIESEMIGHQPGNYCYEGWQIAEWSSNWTVVFSLTDAGYDSYPFPWLLGFCRKGCLERNFIELTFEGRKKFDQCFYVTDGEIFSQWSWASIFLQNEEA